MAFSGDLQAPCGFDGFSYSWRMDPSTVFHESNGRPYGLNNGYKVGDVVGIMIHLPENGPVVPDQKSDELNDAKKQWYESKENAPSSSKSGRKTPRRLSEVMNRFDPLPDLWTPDILYVPVKYYLPRPRLVGSWIRFFVNGADQGVAFRDLFYGKSSF